MLRERLERTREEELRPAWTSSCRSRSIDGQRPSAQRLLVGLGQPALPLAARDRGDGVDRRVVLLHRARQPPRAAARTPTTRSAASAARRGRCTAAASTASRSSASRRSGCPSRCTGSSGRRTRPGSPGFALFIVVYYSHASSFLIDPSVADLTAWEAIAISIAGLVIAWLVYDGLCRAFAERRGRARGARVRVHLPARRGRLEPLRAARRVPAGRRDDRDDDGRQRLLRDHPGALEARAREGGRASSPTRAGTATARRGRCTTTT